jgi:hypothetical protein
LTLDYPVIYDAIASTPVVRYLRFPCQQLKTILPADVIKMLEVELWPRLRHIKDRLQDIHETRKEIAKMDLNAEKYQETVNHIEKCYPNSNKNVQKRIRMAALSNSGGSSNLVLISDNRRRDK